MKQILITGANGQLGSYLAKAYHQEGYALELLYHKRKQRIVELFDEPNVMSAACDLTDFNGLNQKLAMLKVKPDILIHCASVRSSDALPLAETEPETFCRVFNSNLYSCYNILRLVLPLMQESGRGRVIIMGSDISQSGLARGSAYAAAKAAMVNMVKSGAKEMAGQNILINAISPAPIDTDLEEDYQGEYLEFRKKYFADFVAKTPTGKLVSKDEIKRVIDMLIDDDIMNLTGKEIVLDGGLS